MCNLPIFKLPQQCASKNRPRNRTRSNRSRKLESFLHDTSSDSRFPFSTPKIDAGFRPRIGYLRPKALALQFSYRNNSIYNTNLCKMYYVRISGLGIRSSGSPARLDSILPILSCSHLICFCPASQTNSDAPRQMGGQRCTHIGNAPNTNLAAFYIVDRMTALSSHM